MADSTLLGWGIWEWGSGLIAAGISAVIGNTHLRLNQTENLVRSIEATMRLNVDRVAREGTDEKEELRKEMQAFVRDIQSRLMDMPTKQDLRDTISLALNRQKP